MESFIVRNLQSTTKTDHILVSYIRQNPSEFIRTFCWSIDDVTRFIDAIRDHTTGVTDSIIERKIVGGVYQDRTLSAEGESVSYYTIELKDHYDTPDIVYEFRHIHDMTTAPPSISTRDLVMLSTRIERLVFNVRNKMNIIVAKNELGISSITAQITHPQDATKLLEFLEWIASLLNGS
jgi:hypothetical protein